MAVALGMSTLGNHERLREAAVEPLRDVARQLEVLALVLADRHQLGVVGQHVGGLQHRVGEQADGGGVAALPRRLVLELRHPRRLPEAGEAAQHPGQLGVGGHLALHEDGAAGRVDTQRQVLRGGHQGAAAQRLGILRRR